MKFLSGVASAAAGLTMLVGGAYASDLKTAAEATFKIYDGDRGMCSSTFYRNDPAGALFITAAHCVDGKGSQYNLRRQNVEVGATAYNVLSETVYHIKAIKTLKRDDVALIQLKDKAVTFSEKPVDFITPDEAAKIDLGTEMMAVGYPFGAELTVTKGEFTAKTPGIAQLDIDGPLYRFTATVNGGNSGGGLYAKVGDDWKYVGTVNVKMNRTDGVAQWGTTPETIDKLLTGFKVSAATGEPVIGLKSAGSIDER